VKIQNINLSRTSKEVPYERRKSTKTRHTLQVLLF